MKLNLLQISLISSLFGIFILIILMNLPLKQIKINQITTQDLNKQINIQGKIQSIKSFKESNFQIIALQDSTGEINITIDKILNLQKNQTIIVIGKITEYNKQLQIQANKISLIQIISS